MNVGERYADVIRNILIKSDKPWESDPVSRNPNDILRLFAGGEDDLLLPLPSLLPPASTRFDNFTDIFVFFFFFNRGLIFNKQFISPQRDDPLFVTCCTRYQIFFSFIFYTLLEISFAKGGRGFKLFKRIGKRPRCLSNRSWLCIFQKAEKKSIFKGDVLVFFKFCFSVQI